ncbi:MAG: GNAT family N-acetyltransferase [Phaeodactylibacter sp.]|nr:GNAT family N-acetyltransferase [Phaeodactylibacter sp.]
MKVHVVVADQSHGKYSTTICDMINAAALTRGTGIAKREPEYIRRKLEEGSAVIALHEQEVVGFCYIESWEDKKYVANSGLIVHPDFRNTGLAKAIKREIFQLSRQKYPEAKLFGITTSLAVMKINTELGYRPVTFSELTQDETFWKGCQSCPNYDVLTRTERKMCLCTGMVCDLKALSEKPAEPQNGKAWEKLQDFLKRRKERIQTAAQKFPKLYYLTKNDQS